MQLSKDQQKIVNSEEKLIKVGACAGSGKTSTVKYYVKKRPNNKILYIVYNKSMRVDMEKAMKGIKHNCEISTFHSLCYRKENIHSLYKHKLTGNYSGIDALNDLRLDVKNNIRYGYQLVKAWSKFLTSGIRDIDDFLKTYESYDFNKERAKDHMIELLKMKIDPNSEVKFTHDFYVFLFFIKNPNLSMYDTVILDECLTGDSFVKTDEGDIRIKKLYDKYKKNKKLPMIKSYNILDKKFEYKEMTWAMKSDDREILSIKTEELNKLQCTKNHKILTNKGYVRADELNNNSYVLTDNINNAKLSKIKSIEKYGQSDVYDIEVKDNHNFITSTTRNSTGIIVHNCQDSSDIVYSILNNFKGNILLLGDKNQNIYSYMNTINMFEKFDGKGVNLDLVESFRVCQDIANVCNKLFYKFLNEKTNMIGLNSKNKIVDHVDISSKHTVLCRNNTTIFEKAHEQASNYKSICFIGGIKSYKFMEYFEYYKFRKGMRKYNKIQLLRNFNSWKELIDYANETCDDELLRIIKIVNMYGDKIEGMINQIKLCTVTNQKDADVTYSTVHKSKGLTISEPLIVNDDILDVGQLSDQWDVFSNLEKQMYVDDIKSEIMISYVALTRGKGLIQIPNCYKNL